VLGGVNDKHSSIGLDLRKPAADRAGAYRPLDLIDEGVTAQPYRIFILDPNCVVVPGCLVCPTELKYNARIARVRLGRRFACENSDYRFNLVRGNAGDTGRQARICRTGGSLVTGRNAIAERPVVRECGTSEADQEGCGEECQSHNTSPQSCNAARASGTSNRRRARRKHPHLPFAKARTTKRERVARLQHWRSSKVCAVMPADYD
jgi:hypothetical protein